MLPEAQKEVLLGGQDLRQLWGSESNSSVTEVLEGGRQGRAAFPVGRMENGQRQGSVGVAFCFLPESIFVTPSLRVASAGGTESGAKYPDLKAYLIDYSI